MSVQKINAVNYILINKVNKSSSPQNHTDAIQYNNRKHVSLNDMLYSYPISFGANEKTDSATSGFEASLKKHYRLNPDRYQIEAARHIYEGSDTLVDAPTGTGKTLIAEYAINKNMEEGKTTFYTTPLKALSNEKYTDFCKLYGKENVGLLTGDIKINSQAPIVIMTTEIYRNMLMGSRKQELDDRLQDVASVIYDEFHYMNDPERGEVWETSIMYTPPYIQQILLSATQRNGNEIMEWMNRLLKEKNVSETQKVSIPQNIKQSNIVKVPPEERHVPLKYYIYDHKKSKNTITPLIKEKYNLQKLGKALNPDSKTELSDKQIEVLKEIASKAGLKDSAVSGLGYLMKNAEMKGPVEKLEEKLVVKLNYNPVDAQRAAAILSDKSERSFNEALKADKLNKEQKHTHFASKAPQKLISHDRIDSMINTEIIPKKIERLLMQVDRSLGGKGYAKDGLKRLNGIISHSDMSVKEFKKRLVTIGIKPEGAQKIADEFTITIHPERTYDELDLIDTLERENKLPAIFFNFSKKECNNLKEAFLKTGKSLLNDEEKAKAAEIIKKHLSKDVFLGTGEDESSLLSGAAVHHAGKMPSYKALVEELAQNKLVKVVFATSTLGAGINVPAKTVVFTELTRYSGASNNTPNAERFVNLTPSEFQQMAGRAGRRGKDAIGNVIVMPDKEHSAINIYNLVNEKPDAINSSFKPTYSFISHYITSEGNTDNLSDAVDKSFLTERLLATGQKPYKVINGIKKQFERMADVLKAPELECFTEKDGILTPTIKGEVVSKARGLNGLLFAEVIFNSGLEHLTPQEMAAVACALTAPDDRENKGAVTLSDSVSDTLFGIDKLKEKIEKIEFNNNVESKEIVLNQAAAQYISQWANITDNDSRRGWEEMIKNNMKGSMTFNEGDFLKTVNRTVDVLEQIKEISRFAADEEIYRNENYPAAKKMRKINEIASQALALIKRDPVTYEL